MPTEKLHHLYGPSSLLRRRLCPASAREERGLPDIPNEAAENGTRLHALMAEYIEGGKLPTCSEEDAELLTRCRDAVAMYLDPAYYDVRTEVRMQLNHYTGVLTSGTCDLLIQSRMDKSQIWICDWKFGMGEVSDEDAYWQLCGYAAMALQLTGADTCHAKIVQPTVRGGLSREWQDFSGAATLTANIRQLILRCQEPAAPHVPDANVQCRYCRACAQGTCPAVRTGVEVAEAQARLAESGEDPVPMARWTDEMLAKFLSAAELAERAIKAARDEMAARLRAGHAIDGWALEERAGRRTADTLKVWQCVQGRLSPAEMLDCCTVSLPKAEKAWAAKEAAETGCPKKAAAEAIRQMLEKTGAATQGAPTMVLTHGR